MKYQFVIQWAASTINNYDEMIEVEEILIKNCLNVYEVDGHDMGNNKVNIFLFTDDLDKSFETVRSVLVDKNLMKQARIAYRNLGDSKYRLLWPDTISFFTID